MESGCLPLPQETLLQQSSNMKSRRQARYVVGIDFGTLSGRALLVDLDTGEEVATAVQEYADGVIEETLPGDRKPLPPNTALQNPADYLQVLETAVPRVLRAARAKPENIIG